MLFITSSNWVFNFTEIWVCKVTDYTLKRKWPKTSKGPPDATGPLSEKWPETSKPPPDATGPLSENGPKRRSLSLQRPDP